MEFWTSILFIYNNLILLGLLGRTVVVPKSNRPETEISSGRGIN